MTPSGRSAELRLALFYAAYFAFLGVQVPYFTLYLAAQGLGGAQIASVLAATMAARIVGPPAWGWLADRSGGGRGIVVFSLLATALGHASLYAVSGYTPVLAVVALTALLSAGALPLAETLAMRALADAPGRYGPVRLWGSVSFIAAVLAAGAALDTVPAALVPGAIAILAALAVVAAAGLPVAGAARGPRRDAPLGAVLRRPEVLCFLGASLCMSVAHSALYAFYTLYLDSNGYSKASIGALWTLGVVAEVLVFRKLPALLARYTLRTLLLASFLAAGVRFTGVGLLVEWPAVMALLQLLHALTFGTFHAASVALVPRLFPGALAGRGQSLYAAVGYGAGGALGMLITGWSWQALGPVPSFALGSAFGLFGGLLVLWRVRG